MRVQIGVLTGLLLVGFAPVQPAVAQTMNACGCYLDDKGVCKCAKKSKCGCPEECEPVGCEEKRQKAADRTADAELKQIAAHERKRAAEAAKQAKSNSKAKAAADKEKEKAKAKEAAASAEDPLPK